MAFDDDAPYIVLNRRMRTQKKMWKFIYDICINNTKYGIRELLRGIWCSQSTLSSIMGPKYILENGKKIYIIDQGVRDDVKKISELLRETYTFKEGSKWDKRKMMSAVYYILFDNK